MRLSASLSDFDFDVIAGVNGKDIPKKALSGVSTMGTLNAVIGNLTAICRSGRIPLITMVSMVS